MQQGKSMIEIQTFVEITQIRMSWDVGGNPVYWVASYLVYGLSTDTRCSLRAG